MPKPNYCRPQAYSLFADQLPVLDTTHGLLMGAIAISSHQLEDLEPAMVDARIDGFAEAVRSRVRGSNPHALLAHLHDVLFELEGFGGNAEDYYNPLNSYLPVVLETKRGIPITLALIYKCIAERVGLQVRGINAPGHFLASVLLEGSWMLVDPFAGGRAMTKEEAIALVEQIAGSGLENPELLLEPATHRQWLARMLQNLQAIFAQTKRVNDLAAMQELQDLLS